MRAALLAAVEVACVLVFLAGVLLLAGLGWAMVVAGAVGVLAVEVRA